MNTQQILRLLFIMSWIIFIGLCIKTGIMLVTFLISMLTGFMAAQDQFSEMDLSELYKLSEFHYSVLSIFKVVISGLQAYLFLQVVKIIDKINIIRPFSEKIGKLISKMSGTAIQIGIIAVVGNIYSELLISNDLGIKFGSGWTSYLFFAGILYVIAQIFKRGIELQSENELTV